MEIPKELRYTKEHEWARKGKSTITIGITAFAVEQLGDITLVELPSVGDEFQVSDAMGVVESVKSVSDFYAPISGKVVAINEELESQPEIINESPYEEGWLVEMKPSGNEFNELLDHEAYSELIAEE